LGVAAAHATRSSVLVAGAMLMAAGEFVSVHSEADTGQAELGLERAELPDDPVQAAFASACSFAVGAAMPLVVTAVTRKLV